MDLNDIVPAVYAEALLDRQPELPGRSKGAPRPYREPFASDLVVAYVVDDDRGARALLEVEVGALPLDGAALRERAVSNLRKRLRIVDRHGGPDVHMIAAGGRYEASLLVMDRFWNRDRVRVDGDYVVAVPSRDVLMVTGSECPMGIARLRQLAQEGFLIGSQPVTPDLLVRRAGHWSVLPPRARARHVTMRRPGLRGLLDKITRSLRPGAARRP